MAAIVQKMLHHHDAAPRQPSPQQPTASSMEHEREEEKRMLAQWADHQGPLTPGETTTDAEHKMVGHSSQALRQDDFELIKTLGTGASGTGGSARFVRPCFADPRAHRNLCACVVSPAAE